MITPIGVVGVHDIRTWDAQNSTRLQLQWRSCANSRKLPLHIELATLPGKNVLDQIADVHFHQLVGPIEGTPAQLQFESAGPPSSASPMYSSIIINISCKSCCQQQQQQRQQQQQQQQPPTRSPVHRVELKPKGVHKID